MTLMRNVVPMPCLRKTANGGNKMFSMIVISDMDLFFLIQLLNACMMNIPNKSRIFNRYCSTALDFLIGRISVFWGDSKII